MDPISVLHAVLGSIFVLFIPGFAWTFIFFEKKDIDVIERITLSFGLSMAIVPLIFYYIGYLLKVEITLINSTLVILFLILVPAALYWKKRKGRLSL